jgi:hypothetical protein
MARFGFNGSTRTSGWWLAINDTRLETSADIHSRGGLPLPPSWQSLLHRPLPPIIPRRHAKQPRSWARDDLSRRQSMTKWPARRRRRIRSRTSCALGWSDIHLAGGCLLSHWRLPMPPVPRRGRERRLEIARRRALLPHDLLADPTYNFNSPKVELILASRMGSEALRGSSVMPSTTTACRLRR